MSERITLEQRAEFGLPVVRANKMPIADECRRATRFFSITLMIPPSLNNAYKNIKRGGRVLTEQAKQYKQRAKDAIEQAAIFHGFACPDNARLSLTLTLHFRNHHRRDVSNCVKLPEDALAEVLGFDDSRVDRLLVERGEVDADNPRCEITLEVL